MTQQQLPNSYTELDLANEKTKLQVNDFVYITAIHWR